MTNSERASYIRGLMDGLELDPNAKETKVLNAIVELLDDLCVTVDEIDENMAELSGQVDEIDEDLGDWKRITTAWTTTSAAVAAAIITMSLTTPSLR